ncbi:hypothetical protein CHLNCDRAFT_140814 [Chlorella variabilis]|uniref:Little elongation complex subunit 2 C-terminal domain-containing protein n=1 Tax=Chlorella variabilis TaxID=554065 RepID=E1Z697_CHLVA|nr:hypothetical protein CHLNCDRAFT_140814 [Chlorella variabilis]EFN58612.1 hypothetical protein CHLNCDRAFT_140814 [Chlorella variabilis]|eukprot:XP_005850714.1 hypothetical protein CHLNCDRAFT_140814 [Chlorella variabilis]
MAAQAIDPLHSARPSLLSPALPRLPGGGGGGLGLAPTEPCLAPGEYGQPPPPITCDPLPPEVAAKLAAGEGMAVALEGHSKHSQLEWCLEQAAAAARLQRRHPAEAQQAERPARASTRPAAHAPAAGARARAAAALSSSSSEERFGSEGAVSSGALHMHSRASAVLQEPQAMEHDAPPGEASDGGAAEAEAGAEAASEGQAGDSGALLEQELEQGFAECASGAAAEEEGEPAAAPAAAPTAGAEAAAAAGPGAAAQEAAAAAEEEAPGGGDEGGWYDSGSEAAAGPSSPVAKEAAEGGSGAEEQAAGAQSPGKRKRPPAQEAAIQAALHKLGESGWPEFCRKLCEHAERREASAAAGGGRGRGRGRKGGRGRGGKGKAGGSTAAEEVGVQDVLNKNSRLFHEGFAAAYHEAKAQLDKKDTKRQKEERLKEHSKLVGRWSELSTVLSVGDSLHMQALQGRVQEEQGQYMAHVQQKAAGVKYQHCTERQGAQLEEDEMGRRQRVHRGLPRCYRLRAVLPVPTPAAAAAADAGRQQAEGLPLRHVAALRREGRPPVFVRPADGATIPGSNIYLPCVVEAPPGGAGRASGGSGEVYRKAEVPPLAEDPLLAELAQQAQQAQDERAAAAPAADGAAQPLFCLSASAFAAIVSTPMLEGVPAWEIPVTIQQLPPAAAAGAGGEQAGEQQQQQQESGSVVVCLEKPLLPRMMTLRAKQQRLQKYAVLSLGLQQQPQQEQGGEQPQQQQPRTRRSTRGTAAAAAPLSPTAQEQQRAAEEGADGGEEVPPPPPPPPAADGCSGDAAAAPAGGGHGEQRHVVLALSPEYLPEPDLEETTMEELCSWWLKLLLRPAVNTLLVAHVHVPRGKVQSCEELTSADIERQFGGDGAPAEQGGSRMHQAAAAGLELLQQLLRAVGQQPPGRYLLCRVPRDTTCCLFRALPPDLEASDQASPLPCSSTVAREGTVYDLHAAHHRSGATDLHTSPFVPPRWRPLSPDLPQIPFTFPPRSGHLGRKYAKARQRKALPYAWGVLGEGGDFDQARRAGPRPLMLVQHLGQISRADYAQAIGEEL